MTAARGGQPARRRPCGDLLGEAVGGETGGLVWAGQRGLPCPWVGARWFPGLADHVGLRSPSCPGARQLQEGEPPAGPRVFLFLGRNQARDRVSLSVTGWSPWKLTSRPRRGER